MRLAITIQIDLLISYFTRPQRISLAFARARKEATSAILSVALWKEESL
jgi:hypothetical protein